MSISSLDLGVRTIWPSDMVTKYDISWPSVVVNLFVDKVRTLRPEGVVESGSKMESLFSKEREVFGEESFNCDSLFLTFPQYKGLLTFNLMAAGSFKFLAVDVTSGCCM